MHARLNGQMAIVYSITSPKGKVYVGVTKMPLNSRISQHKYSAKIGRDNELYKDIKLLGFEEFSVKCLEKCCDSIRFEREKHWILKTGSYKSGYNKSLGGVGPSGMRVSEKRRKQMSSESKNKWADKSFRKKIMAAKMPSLKDSQMQRKKGILGGIAKGMKKPIFSVYDNGNYIGDFRLAKDLAKHLDVCISTADRYLRGKIGRKRFALVRKDG